MSTAREGREPDRVDESTSDGAGSQGSRSPAGRWAVVLLLSSLLIPAASKQWTDRNAEIELKGDLVHQLSVLTISTFATTNVILDDLTPEAVVRERCQNGEIPESECTGEPLIRSEVSSEQLKAIDSLEALAIQSATIRGLVQAHFEDEMLTAEFLRFDRALEFYFISQTIACLEEPHDIATILEVADLGTDDVPLLFQCEPSTSREFREQRNLLQDQLWAEANRIFEQIIRAETVGFSSGVGDFISDVWWILVISAGVIFAPTLWHWWKRS